MSVLLKSVFNSSKPSSQSNIKFNNQYAQWLPEAVAKPAAASTTTTAAGGLSINAPTFVPIALEKAQAEREAEAFEVALLAE